MKKIIFLVNLFYFLSTQIVFSGDYIQKNFPCKIKECEPKWGDTITRYYKGDPKLPAIIWYQGGGGGMMDLGWRPQQNLEGKIDFIIMASPVPMINKGQNGKAKNSDKKELIYRSREVIEYYKNKLNKPIWLGGHSNGGPRTVAVIMGKDKYSENLAGLIFSSANVGKGNQIGVKRIKYQMNLPIMIVNHIGDNSPDTSVAKQKWLHKELSKRNNGKTELVLLTGGNPKSYTDYNNPHHMFMSNLQEYADSILKFVKENSK